VNGQAESRSGQGCDGNCWLYLDQDMCVSVSAGCI
jgi:hypothetical protein